MRDDPAWPGTTSIQMAGKILGIGGLGESGAYLARSGHGLGMEIVAHTRTPSPGRVEGVAVRFAERVALLAEAHFVVLCLPLTPETHHLIDRSTLALMRSDAYVINVARGPVVATDDLLEAVAQGRLAGAGLDVTDPEPLPADHPLRRFPNVLISPHNAGRTIESQAEALARMRVNVRSVLDGRPPTDPVT
jgi:phosphoglycerate dehydrogenase-like enzyme